jgi:hypothetical protein
VTDRIGRTKAGLCARCAAAIAKGAGIYNDGGDRAGSGDRSNDGIPAAIGAGKLMTGQLFGVNPWDPVMLTLATVLLGVAALLATVIPARRAASVEPMVALRSE